MSISEKDFKGLEGMFTLNAPLGQQSWFRCGGHADLLFEPSSPDDLCAFLKQLPDDAPMTIIGGMANMIIRDGGIRGVTVRLGKAFSKIDVLGDHIIRAECGALNGSVAAAAVKAGIGELEFLSGIPGSLGGACRMNAGAYGREIKDVLRGLTVVTREGNIKLIARDDLIMSYRHTDIAHDDIVISAVLSGKAEGYDAVKARMNDIKAKRNATQPIRESTGGSTFANPSAEELGGAGLPDNLRAWQIVEKVGGRGLTIGGAQMSEKHCNFMINTGDATASDLEMLGDEIRARALHELGVNLRWEIKRVGEYKA